MFDQLESIQSRYEEITHLISQPEIVSDSKKFMALTKEHASLREVVESFETFKKIINELSENESIVADPDEDPELKEIAQEELLTLKEQKTSLEEEIKILLLPKDPDDDKNAILEIRAGTGGDEAALFVRDLLKMYTKFAELKRWKISVISESPSELGGFKEVVLSIEGDDVFSYMKFESGVHRVQRVPKTETQGRVHTSAATVAVMPEAEEVEIEINPAELRIDVFRSSGPGGQSVNTTDSAVRITHIPTGLVVSCQNEKSQHKNRAAALKVLRARLHEQELESQKSAESETRRNLVGSGDRSEKIRTYNFPQGRVTDHRINLTLYQLDQVLMGQLSLVIDPLITHNRAELMKQGA